MLGNLLAFLLAVVILCHSIVIAASEIATIKSLQQADKLRINVRIEPQQNIIPKQQVKLIIEVATDKWFRGGTKIGRVEIDDAIVLQRENFAENSTRKEADKNWVVQEWTQVIYPQREGEFSIPSFPVTLSIAGDNLEAIVGQAYTTPLIFSAAVPDELKDKNNWIVTNRFDINTNFDKPDKILEQLKTGDALTRTIIFSAENLPAMMLPQIETNDIPGIAIYHKPPRVSDKVNRGEYLAERVETVTYLFEKPGTYQLPSQRYYWWNLETKSLETIDIPKTILQVSKLAGTVKKIEEGTVNTDNLFIKWSLILLFIFSIWFVGRGLFRYFKTKKDKKTIIGSERSLLREFNKACRVNDYKKAMRLFYLWLDYYGGESFQGAVRVSLNTLAEKQALLDFNKIMRSIYTENKNNTTSFKLFARHFIRKLEQSGQARRWHRFDVKLNLN